MALLGHHRILDQSHAAVSGGTLAIFKALYVFMQEKEVELWVYSRLCVYAREG